MSNFERDAIENQDLSKEEHKVLSEVELRTAVFNMQKTLKETHDMKKTLTRLPELYMVLSDGHWLLEDPTSELFNIAELINKSDVGSLLNNFRGSTVGEWGVLNRRIAIAPVFKAPAPRPRKRTRARVMTPTVTPVRAKAVQLLAAVSAPTASPERAAARAAPAAEATPLPVQTEQELQELTEEPEDEPMPPLEQVETPEPMVSIPVLLGTAAVALYVMS